MLKNYKLYSIKNMLIERQRLRRNGRPLVLVNGCFDLLHAGHVYFLLHAKWLGSALVVVLNTDRSVRELKGEGRPIYKEQYRAYMLAALTCVDYIVMFPGLSYTPEVAKIQPDVVAFGRDSSEVKERSNAATLAAIYPRARIEFISLPIGPSTSTTIKLRTNV